MLTRIGLASSIIALAIAPATAKTYNAVKQFTTTTNSDTSTWSYRASDGGGHDGNYALLTNVGTISVMKNGRPKTLPDWYTPSADFGVPIYWANKSAAQVTTVSNGDTISFPAQTLVYHPGYDNVSAVLSFLAPKSGTATINYDYTHLDWSCGAEGVGIAWSIEKNFGNGALASGHLYSPNAQNIDTTGPQTTSVAVVAGDRINFIIDGANPPYCDSTGLAATVSVH
jgi:hypothetical protein